MTLVNVSKCASWKGFSVKICGFSHNRTLLMCIVVLLTGLSATAPMPLNQKSDEFWTNSCGRQIRHSRSSGIDTNKTNRQMTIFGKLIEQNIIKESLAKLYPHHLRNERTGSCKCFNIKAFMKHLNKFKGTKEITENFYQIIIKLGKFIDKLMAIPVETAMKLNTSLRKEIYEETRLNLRRVVCEFNITLSHYFESHSGVEYTQPEVPDFREGCLQKSFDSSTAQMMDVDFFRRLKTFFKRSLKLLKKTSMKKNGGKKRGGKKFGAKSKGVRKNKTKGRKRTKNSRNMQ
ncbi:uncharacterized protein isoform X2 [Leptinotarsa decemlineata]|uniref:uncharacterized protein isoform X2 n=1 Tax=Leptinotarsa decemlineata TaxID=7539 RepID=UPI003D30D6D8